MLYDSIRILIRVLGLLFLFFECFLANAQTNLSIVKAFRGLPESAGPLGSLIEDKSGNLYGTSCGGGSNSLGTVFKVAKDGSGYQVIRHFSGVDGQSPKAALVEGGNGSLYGTTRSGGTANFGVVFRMDKDGANFSVLHSFLGDADGANPIVQLTRTANGLLYGTTDSGSATTRGTIFKIDEDGNDYSVLHAFAGSTAGDGQNPRGKLLMGSDGALYGTTFFGGKSLFGTVFRVAPDGSAYTILKTFTGRPGDGTSPSGGVIEGSDGRLYGTTIYGGSFPQGGIVFSLNKDGTGFVVLREFLGTDDDGTHPNGDLLDGGNGELFGTTQVGGILGRGTIFKINIDGSGYQVLHRFLGGAAADGMGPNSGLLLGSDGKFYGTTVLGGGLGQGCVYSLGPQTQPPQVGNIAVVQSTVTLELTGNPGSQYDLGRSENLTNWSIVATITTNPDGKSTFTDLAAPSAGAFYRLTPH
jgi:uncharacterized repeat protein (TIGR03803 family)